MSVAIGQRMYRAPFVYFCQSLEAPRLVRIGHTMRPTYELQRLQQRYEFGLLWHCQVRAFAILAPILWARFAYCGAGGQWFHPDRRLMAMVEVLNHRDEDSLLTADQLRTLFGIVFPDNPYAGIAQYRMSETYVRRTRTSTY